MASLKDIDPGTHSHACIDAPRLPAIAGQPSRLLGAHEALQMLALLPDLAPLPRSKLVEASGGPVGAVYRLLGGWVPTCKPRWGLREWRDRAATTAATVASAGGKVLTLESSNYPPWLRELPDAPATLYVRGFLPALPAIAVVGSRRCSSYGRRIAYQIAADLARAGLLVVSGLARGVDAAAHRGALDSGGHTVAVLPCGIERVYPAQHRALARRMVARGGLLTEYPPETPVAKWRFPVRNRLIAGLARVTVVVEAASQSGARITAELALDYGRDVMAVPGPISSPTSAGAHALLAQGASPCTSWRDVVEQLQRDLCAAAEARHAAAQASTLTPAKELSRGERLCLSVMPASGACSVEILASSTSMAIPALLATLTSLEARGLVRSLGGQRYERAQVGTEKR
ncbi:MAG: DNA-processing protein DprA [Acidobacteriota bacterium]